MELWKVCSVELKDNFPSIRVSPAMVEAIRLVKVVAPLTIRLSSMVTSFPPATFTSALIFTLLEASVDMFMSLLAPTVDMASPEIVIPCPN